MNSKDILFISLTTNQKLLRKDISGQCWDGQHAFVFHENWLKYNPRYIVKLRVTFDAASPQLRLSSVVVCFSLQKKHLRH